MTQITDKKIISDTSVIIAVYNHFEWLRLVLDSLRSQSVSGFEVVIADDGSNQQTVAAIQDYCQRHPELKIAHSWQPDEGWRKNKCLNKAVRKASGDFLIFIDGDCIPHDKFVEDHLRMRSKGLVMGGRRVEMSKDVSDMVESWESLPTNFFKKILSKILSDLTKRPLSESCSQLRRMIRFPFIGNRTIFSKRNYFWGCNFGIYRSDLELVNGFDERYIDPGTGEDIDLGVRLENAGIKLLKNSHYALMVHRHHARLDFSSPNNADLFDKAVKLHVTRIEDGLVKTNYNEKN